MHESTRSRAISTLLFAGALFFGGAGCDASSSNEVTATQKTAERLSVDGSGRHLNASTGLPLFFLGDTATRLVHRLDRADVEHYFQTRASQGFTVSLISAVRAHYEEIALQNQYGDHPFVLPNPGDPRTFDITQPAVTPGSDPSDSEQYDWWDHLDYVIDRAAAHGIMIGLVPFAVSGNGFQYINAGNAAAYGQFIGARYGNRSNVFWVLGWDNSPGPDWAGDPGNEIEIWNELARGITLGTAGTQDWSRTLMTFHPGSPDSSSNYFHNEPWLDFNMIQTHVYPDQTLPLIASDRARQPSKPTGVGEAFYENSEGGPLLMRRQAYQAFLSGGYHIYGNISMWHMDGSGPEPWKQAIQTASAWHMKVLRDQLAPRAWWTYEPSPSMIVSGSAGGIAASVAAQSTSEGRAIVYVGHATTITIDTSGIGSSATLRATWIDPTSGASSSAGSVSASGTHAFTTPSGWEDAVLLLETCDASTESCGTTTTSAVTHCYDDTTTWNKVSCDSGCGCLSCWNYNNGNWQELACPSSCKGSCGSGLPNKAPTHCYDDTTTWNKVSCDSGCGCVSCWNYDGNWHELACPSSCSGGC